MYSLCVSSQAVLRNSPNLLLSHLHEVVRTMSSLAALDHRGSRVSTTAFIWQASESPHARVAAGQSLRFEASRFVK